MSFKLSAMLDRFDLFTDITRSSLTPGIRLLFICVDAVANEMNNLLLHEAERIDAFERNIFVASIDPDRCSCQPFCHLKQSMVIA
jgi:hypothetical protein